MKTFIIQLACITALLFVAAPAAHAQSSAFTYQGHLNKDAAAANGNYDFSFALYDAPVGGAPVGSFVLLTAVPVSNGLFTVLINTNNEFGAAAFNGEARWLEIGARINTNVLLSFTALTPRQPIAATPYAIRSLLASNLAGTLPVAQLTGTIPAAQLPASVVTNGASGLSLGGTFGGNGAGLTALNASQLGGGTVPDARLAANVARTNQVWLLGGNAGTSTGHFIGTTDNQPLELKVNNVRALRFEDNGDGSEADGIRNGAPNVIGGSPTNFVAAGVVGATISGGGATNYFGSQWPNLARSDYAVVAGGLFNRVENNSFGASIGGGTFHQISSGSANSAIGGGNQNSIGTSSSLGTIAGGESNDIRSNAPLSTISGGYNNTIANASFSAIAGGRENNVDSNCFSASIGGGDDNNILADASYATIGGGRVNDIGRFAAASVISGGEDNNIGFNSHSTTISGGRLNDIGSNSFYSVIAGGQDNNIDADSPYSLIVGGFFNDIGTSSPYSVVIGGEDNNIEPNSPYAAILGGRFNGIGTNSPWSTIGGGDNNNIGTNSRNASIAGGSLNSIGAGAAFAVIAGGSVNSIAQGSSAATIAGGVLHQMGANARYGTIGGGDRNLIASNSEAATIAGGSQNVIGTNALYSTISGGNFNSISDGSRYSVIAGGFFNTSATNAPFATIPGGRYNFATSNAFAAGSFASAAHSGSFVWADATDQPLASTNANSFTLRASGGYRLFSGLSVGAYLAPNSSSWAVMSDRNVKKDFTRVDSVAVLEKLASLPITKWHYKWESAGATPHLGPMAQDFKAAFYPGRDDKTITTLEADGVALAAIQGLNEKVEVRSRKLEEKLQRKETEIAELRQTVSELKELVEAMNHKLKGGAQ